MSTIPQPPRGGTSRLPQYGRAQGTAAYRHPHAPSAQSLLQYWRSDSTAVPGRRRMRWPGRVAFVLGLASAIVLLFGAAATGLPEVVTASVAAALSWCALAFAVVAIVARLGRGLGWVGALLALAGNVEVWAWLWRAVGAA